MRKLKLLLMAFALLGGASSANAQEEPVNGNAYYIYNADYDLFFTRGGAYGTEAYASPLGIPWRVEIADGNYTLKMYDIYTQNPSADSGLGYNGSYTDNGTPIALTPNGDATNGFTLKNGDNYITCPSSKGVVTMTATASSWIFLTQAQYEAVLAARASSQESAIATSKGITIPSGNTLADVVSDNTAWTSSATNDAIPTKSTWTLTTRSGENRDNTYNEGTYGVELFQANDAHISKTIPGLAKGIYKVSVRGMKRMGTNAGSVAMENAGFYVSDAYLKANGNIIPMKSWAADNTADNVPDGPAAVVEIINNGGYTTDGFVYVGDDGNLALEVYTDAFWWGGWTVFNGISYTYYNNEVSEAEATAILATATTLLEQEMDATLKSNLTSAKTTFDGARTIANYNALQTAIDDAQASAEAYALFALERTKALALGMTSEAIAALAPDVNALKVAEYTFVTTNYPHGVSLGEWTKVNATDRSGQHWDNTSSSPYYEQNEGWGSQYWDCSYTQNISLPAGKYVFKVAGRKSSEAATLTLTVKNGNTTIGTVNDFPNGDTGKGIDTSGATNFGDGTFAFNGAGRGWEWRYVQFELTNPATVEVSVAGSANDYYQWVGFCNATVQTDEEDNVALMEALVNLNNAKTTATLTKITDNVGTGVFQCIESSNNSLWSAYETAKNNADNYTLTSSSTVEEVNGIVSALNTAISNYKNQPLNAPVAGTHYNIIVATTGHSLNGNAIVLDRVAEYPVYQGSYISNNSGFTLNASATPNVNLAQACVFTAVDGKDNTYYISMERTEGTVYLTYGSLNDSKVNWKADQIQATTDASKKGEFRIAATTTSGVFNIVNTNDDKLIGCEDGGNIYATDNNGDFSIEEAEQASVRVNIASDVKYATRIFPFAPTLPEGVKAYSCAGESSGTLTLDEVATPAANTPYILYAENGYPATGEAALSGWGTAANLDAKTDGWLTGVYVATDAPVNSYVLQNNSKVAFYKVVENEEPTVGANRCYMTVSAGARDAFFFDEGEATAIDAISALTSGEAQIFNAAGAQLPSLQKGMNILQLSNGKSIKVMVK